MEEDDDFYGNGATAPSEQPHPNGEAENDIKMDDEIEEGEEEEDSDDDDDSDDEIEIITERTEEPQQPAQVKSEPSKAVSATPAPKLQPATTSVKQETVIQKAPADRRPGHTYPEVRTSTVDLEPNPYLQAAGKPITEVDIDADLAEHDKPWRLPGASQTDYFNYGFDEFTWTSYCLLQKRMTSTLSDQKAQTAQFEAMFGMPSLNPQAGNSSTPSNANGNGSNNPAPPANAPTGPSGMNAAVGGMPPMPSMPGQDEMMQQMMAQMVAQGISDPSQLDFNTFMQGMTGMGGPGAGAGGPPQGQQPPTGPAAQFQQGGQWGGGGGGGYAGGGRGRGGRRW